MATIGHTFAGVGLALPVEMDRPGRPSSRWWLGAVVLASHFPDVGEWLLGLVSVQPIDSKLLHGIPAVSICVALFWIVMASLGRVRSIAPFLIVGLAMFSHLLMDERVLRQLISESYRRAPPDSPTTGRTLDLASELWCYGTAPVIALLIVAARWSGRTRSARRGALVLIPAVLLGLLYPRPRVAWIALDAAAVGYAVWALRPRPRRAWLWNLLPLLPMLSLGAVEAWASIETRRGLAQESRGRYRDALASFERAVTLPTRSDSTIRWWYIARCREAMGNPAGAEQALKECVARDNDWHWAEYELAKFYLRMRGTPYHQPDRARRLLRNVIDSDRPVFARRAAEELMKQRKLEPAE
ncbi:MAG: hypothetical protein HUU22_14615 [Phycisphaerae bacterium]|nr:tetratricopeptide repeat protein [Phycisphaerae bacterium]NUQ47254.1 hypothetical protein [Phycisphaerae bacterium]